MCYFNARSLRSNLSAFHSVIYSNEYHIICVTETWLDSNILDGLLDLNNKFKIFRRDRAAERKGDGVCILVNKSIDACNIDFSTCVADVKAEIVVARITIEDVILIIVCVYIAPNLSNLKFSCYVDILSALCSSYTSLVVGDFNQPNINWEKYLFPHDFKSRELLRLCTEGALTQCNFYPTRK